MRYNQLKLNRIAVAVFLFIIIHAGSACSDKTTPVTITTHICPAFADSAFDRWFPYTTGQIVIFKNTKNAEKKVVIQQVDKSAASTYTTSSPPDPNALTLAFPTCPSAGIYSVLGPTFFRFGVIYMPRQDNTAMIRLIMDSITIQGSAVRDSGMVLNVSPVPSKRYSSNYLDSLGSPNGTNYRNVQVITRDTATDHSKEIYKVFIAAKYGVVRFDEYPLLESWTKQ